MQFFHSFPIVLDRLCQNSDFYSSNTLNEHMSKWRLTFTSVELALILTFLGHKNRNFGPIDLKKKRYCRKFARESIATIKSDFRAIFRELEMIFDTKLRF